MPTEAEEVERLARDPQPPARGSGSAARAPLLDNASPWGRAVPERDYSLPAFVRTEMKLHLDPGEWGAGFLQVHERELPPELFADLREQTPQATLRDLYRPVQDFYVTPVEIEGSWLVGRWKEG